MVILATADKPISVVQSGIYSSYFLSEGHLIHELLQKYMGANKILYGKWRCKCPIYIKNRRQDDAFYEKLIIDCLQEFGKASRKDLDKLLWNKLSDVLDDTQKQNKIGNLLTKLRRKGSIKNMGSRTSPEWHLAERLQKEK